MRKTSAFCQLLLVNMKNIKQQRSKAFTMVKRIYCIHIDAFSCNAQYIPYIKGYLAIGMSVSAFCAPPHYPHTPSAKRWMGEGNLG